MVTTFSGDRFGFFYLVRSLPVEIDRKPDKSRLEHSLYPSYFYFGAVLLYLFLFVIPGITGVVFSFTDWNAFKSISDSEFVGFRNFRLVFSGEERYFKYLGNTALFAVVTTVAKSTIALAIALMLISDVKFRNFHRLAMFFPSIISILVTGLIFRVLLNPGRGLVNESLRAIGLGVLARDWLNSVDTAFASVMFVDIWRGVGYIMVVYIAGLVAIPPYFFEAAAVDGASYLQRLRHITLPLLKQTIIVTAVLNVIYGLRVFDIIYVLTKGGPGDATDVVYTSVFREFGQGNFALGSALSSVMLILLLATGFFSLRPLLSEEVEY